MNFNNIEKFVTPSEEYNHKKYSKQIQKRKREDNLEPNNNKENKKVNKSEPEIKKKQSHSLFRPWSDIKETKITEEPAPSPAKISAKKDMAPSVSHQTNIPLPPTPVLISPYFMAMQERQHHIALSMQQAMYQRQMFVANLWARQHNYEHHQQQQMMMHHHQQQQQHQMRQQQMFAYNQQQGQ